MVESQHLSILHNCGPNLEAVTSLLQNWVQAGITM